MAGEERTDSAEMPGNLEYTSQSSLDQFSLNSGGLMSWTEIGSEGKGSPVRSVSDLSELTGSNGKKKITSHLVDPSQSKTHDQVPDSSEKPETCIPESWSFALPLNYYNDLKSVLCVRGAELEERMNVLVAQFTARHVNLPIFLVSNVLLFTVGVFIGRRSNPELV